MSNGDKSFIFKSKSIKQSKLIKKNSPFEEIQEINNKKDDISKYSIDYHLKNENILNKILINKRLSKQFSYKKKNNKIVDQSFKSTLKEKSQYIKKFFDLNSIKSLNEELRKSGSLLGNNREKPKRKSRLEHSRELNKNKLSNKNLEFLRRSFNKSDYESFNEQREKIIRNRTLEPYRLEKIIKKLKFPYFDSEIEYNSYIVFNGKKIRKAYSMRNKDLITLANSINSLIYSESLNDNCDMKSFNQRIKFNNFYDENINIKKYYYENIPILKKTNEEGKYIFRIDLTSKDKINELTQINKTINISSDNSTKQDFSSIQNRRKNLNENIFEDNESSSSDDDLNNKRKLIKKEVIIINNPITGEKELINYDDGKKINDIKLNINEDGN